MSTATPSPIRTDRRRAVLDAAGPVFGDAGYERASVDAIAAAAGVSKPTIYAYFGSKERLFRETMADIARQLNEASYEAVRGLDLHPDRWEQSLRDLALALSGHQRSGCAASLARLVLGEAHRDPAVFAEVRRAGYDPIREVLAGRLAMLGNAGLLRVADPDVAAQHLLALTQSHLSELTVAGTETGDEAAIRSATEAGVDAFLRAYAI